jgi:hypothetical protein
MAFCLGVTFISMLYKPFPIDLAGRPTDLAGRPTDLAGRPTDLAGRPTDLAGRPTDLAGRHLEARVWAVQGVCRSDGAEHVPQSFLHLES